ncbi:hypothetical protein FALBO_10473 [Fusarium albosuccineum]|uniref:Uncharacterized protein n=1 Tax=Fusarium albosuccineum TaxID=1237068 RepID=A0A8H4L6X6_9HYPO|nr:hypothetical protein FALBO_10473 [Fusarium albosuccineum]
MLASLDLDQCDVETIDELEVLVGPYSVFRHFEMRHESIYATLSMTPDWDPRQRSLFHHYLIAVAPLMMPFEESKNPWNTTYPRLAETCLRQPTFGYLNELEAQQDESNLRTNLTRQNIMRSVMERPDFGFTAGFDHSTINCLLQADTYIKSLPTVDFGQPNEELVMEFIQKTVTDSKLSDSRNEKPQMGATRPQLAASHHSRVVRNGMLIYLYRTLGNHSPSEVARYVSAVLEGVEHYRQAGGRNLTVWPVFQAAVEACTEADQAKARAWLADSLRLGIGNRYHIKKIVEQTWERRRLMADTLGLDVGDVVLDWREIRREANLDILLV